MSLAVLLAAVSILATGCQDTQAGGDPVYLVGDAGADPMEPCEKCDAGANDDPENIPPPDGGWPWVGQDGGTGGEDGGVPTGDAGMSQMQYPEPIFHANCKGQCGLGCNGIAGKHYCTDECWDHDTCVRDCKAEGKFCCHCRCAGGLPKAAKSVIECWQGKRDCSCPHPKEDPES